MSWLVFNLHKGQGGNGQSISRALHPVLLEEEVWKHLYLNRWMNTNVSAENIQDFKAPQNSRKQWAQLLGCMWGRVAWDRPCPPWTWPGVRTDVLVIMLVCKCTYMFTLAEFQILGFKNCGMWRTVQLSCVYTSYLHHRAGICRQNSKLTVKSIILLYQSNVFK